MTLCNFHFWKCEKFININKILFRQTEAMFIPKSKCHKQKSSLFEIQECGFIQQTRMRNFDGEKNEKKKISSFDDNKNGGEIKLSKEGQPNE